MTRIDFYFNVPKQLNFACRLIRKVLYDSKANQEEPIIVFCPESSKFDDFDDLLYSFSGVDFLPHVFVGSPQEKKTPIIMSRSPWLPDLPRKPNLLLNLDDNICEVFGSFDRVVEIVGIAENEKSHAREKFIFYRDRGFEIHNHDVSKKK